MAEAITVRPARLILQAGMASRDKLVRVEDPPDDPIERVAALRKAGR